MSHTRMIYSINILDYYQITVISSGKWLIETGYSNKELDKIVKEMVESKRNPAGFSLKEFAYKMEERGYFKIVEDLTEVPQHSIELEV